MDCFCQTGLVFKITTKMKGKIPELWACAHFCMNILHILMWTFIYLENGVKPTAVFK